MSLEISKILQNIREGNRLSVQDALVLWEQSSLQDLMSLADEIKMQKHGEQVFWVNNRQINYTNICVLHCTFCAFSKIKKDSPVAYDWGIDEVVAKARFAVDRGARELHIVGGLHPDHEFAYYLQMLKTLKQNFPDVTIKAFTAVEICHFAKLENCTVSEVLSKLKDVGLAALPGGGAEILVQSVRDEICGPKETGEEWLMVHKSAHLLGIPTNATMLFGHIETLHHRLEHMEMIRNLQDQTKGFFAFIPLVFHPENNSLGRRVGQKASEEDRLKTVAMSRIFLDNIPHIKAYWVHLGIDVAMRALKGGASDLDGTIIEEKITQAAGADTPSGISALQMVQLITDAGCKPVERDALYHSFENS